MKYILRSFIFALFSVLLLFSAQAQPEKLNSNIIHRCIKDLGFSTDSSVTYSDSGTNFRYGAMIIDKDKFYRTGLTRVWRGDSVYMTITPDENFELYFGRIRDSFKLISPLNGGWYDFIGKEFGFLTDSNFLVGKKQPLLWGRVINPDKMKLKGITGVSKGDIVELCQFEGFYKYEYWRKYIKQGQDRAFIILRKKDTAIYENFDQSKNMYLFSRHIAEEGVKIDRKQAARIRDLSETLIIATISDPEKAAKLGLRGASMGDRIYMIPHDGKWTMILSSVIKTNAVYFKMTESGNVVKNGN